MRRRKRLSGGGLTVHPLFSGRPWQWPAGEGRLRRERSNTMKKFAFVFVALLLTVAGNLFAQQCVRGGCIWGGCTELPLIYDEQLAGCNLWVYSGNVTHQSNGTCSGEPNYALFANGYGTVTQNTVANAGGDTFQFNYTVTVTNANNNAFSGLEVNLYDANTSQLLAHVDSVPPGTNLSCVRRDVLLGSHPDWKNRTLQIRFDGFTYYGVQFRLEQANIWQGTPGH
jgi:hypothetical protein